MYKSNKAKIVPTYKIPTKTKTYKGGDEGAPRGWVLVVAKNQQASAE